MLIGNDFATAAKQVDGALSGLMEMIFGPRVHDVAFVGLKWEDIGVVAGVLALVLIADALSTFVLRHKKKRAAQKPADKVLHRGFLDAVSGPLRLLIWVSGMYLAATLLLMKLSVRTGAEVSAAILGTLFDIGMFASLLWLFFRLTDVLDAWLTGWAARSKSKLDILLAPLVARSLRVIVPVVGIILALPLIGLPQQWAGVVSKASSIMIILVVSWVLFEVVNLGEQGVLARYDVTAADNLRARTIYTQVHVIRKTCYFMIALFGMASVLMLFEEVRRLGTTILASAGAAGIVLGIAAQRTLANLFAGLQIALSQPIRMDDVLVVEGEWGRVEEITLTYVVLHIWDDRRLVLPLSYFIEKPFQNWTRASAQLLGSVFLWTDYSLPVAEVREAVGQIVESSALWDKRFWNLQVSDATKQTMQLRVLATAADSSKAWDLRCEIREKLIDYVQKHHARGLPRRRVEVEQPAGAMPPLEVYANHHNGAGDDQRR